MQQRMPVAKILNIVRKKMRGEILRTIDPEEWMQEAILGYELARREKPHESKHHIFGAIQAVQKLARREHRYKRQVFLIDDENLSNYKWDDNETDLAVVYEMLEKEDKLTQQIIEGMLDGATQYEISIRMKSNVATVNRRVKRFFNKVFQGARQE